MSGFKTMVVGGVLYYIEAITIERLWNLCRLQDLKVDWVAVDEDNARQSMQTLLDTMKGTVAVLDECDILVVGPAGGDSRNECLVTGTACFVIARGSPAWC
jgi:hypothetical protein